jgi:transcriptional regulator with XRE-family HTH domain
MPRLRTLTPSASPMHFFGSEVRRAREAIGMSQTELGDLVPCDKATVSRIEAGLTQPDQAFARACDVAFPRLDGWFTRFHAGSRTWGEAFPPAFRPFAACEAEAVALRDQHSVVYLETAADGQTVEDPGTVANIELRWDTLRTEAFKGTESLNLIESAAEQWKP